MKKMIISFIAVAVSVMPLAGLANGENAYTSYTNRYISSSCNAFKDVSKNEKNIERLEATVERISQNISRLNVAKERMLTNLAKIEETKSSYQENISELSMQPENERAVRSLELRIASADKRIATAQKNIERQDERISKAESEKEELVTFISELQGTIAPSFCIEIYEKENERTMTREERQRINFENRLEKTNERLDAEEEKINNQIFSHQEEINNLNEEINNLKEENKQYREIAASSSFQYSYSLRYVNNVCRYIDNQERTTRNIDSINKALVSLESQIERLENTYLRTVNETSKARLRLQIENIEKNKTDLAQFISEIEFEGKPSYCAETVIKNNEKKIETTQKRIESTQKRIDTLESRLGKTKDNLVKNITVYEEKLEEVEMRLDSLKMKNEGYALIMKSSRANSNQEEIDWMNLDSDGDGLPDWLEIMFGTDPFNPDTDGDGYLDGVEIKHGYNPLGKGKMIKYKNPYAPDVSHIDPNLDSDGDGLPDWLEIMFGTDPFNPDTDGDGYSDYEEIMNGYNPLGEGRIKNWRNPHAPNFPGFPPFGSEFPGNSGNVPSNPGNPNEGSDNNGKPENPGNSNDKSTPPANPGENEDPIKDDNATSTVEYLDYNRGVTIYNTIEKEDFVYFKEVGVSTVRLMLMDGDLLAPSAKFNINTSSRVITDKNIEKIMAVVDLGKEFGIKVIIDVHEFPGLNRWFLSDKKPKDDRLWHPTSEGEQYREALVDVWGQLSKLLSDQPVEAIVYELFNEPEPKTDEDPNENKHYIWNNIQDELIKTIRKNDNKHLIVATSAYSWRMDSLLEWTPSAVVLNDPNIVVSVHGYRPIQFTIQEEAWYGNADYNVYPGYYYEEHYIGEIYWDYEQLDKIFGEIVGSFYEEYEIQVYVAEFAVNRLAPGADTWLLDMMNIMNKNYSEEIWGWSVHVWEEEVYAKVNKLAYNTERAGMNDFTVDEKQLQAVLAGINNTEHTLISR